jgi:NitT/TauT family transport system permease protein
MQSTTPYSTTIPLKQKNKFRLSIKRAWLPLVSPLAVLIFWQVITMLEIYPSFLIPQPINVFEKFVSVLSDGSLLMHAGVTLQAMFIGLLWGVTIGLVGGYIMAKSPRLETILSPLVVAFQSTPVVAYAPLLVVWFGNDITSKSVTCAIIVFFPTMMNTIVGVRSVPQGLRDLMRSLQSTRWQTFSKLELPYALPVFLTGFKTSATLALIGVIVGEFVSARAGLGFLVNIARNQYDTPLVFVSVLTMTFIALFMYTSVHLLQSWLNRL